MALDAGNARIFGSDLDKVQIGPLDATLPTTLGAVDAELVDVGWLHTDGLPFTPADSVEKFRGHQGGGVVRTTITESDLSFGFQCLETTALTLGLQHNILTNVTATGVTTMGASPSRRVLARAFVLDLYDKDDTTIHYRYVIPRGEIGEREEFTYANSDIAGFTFTVEIVGPYSIITNDPAAAVAA